MDILSSPCAAGIDDTIFEEAGQPPDMISQKAGTSVSSLLASRSRHGSSVLRLPRPAKTRHPVLLPSRVSERARHAKSRIRVSVGRQRHRSLDRTLGSEGLGATALAAAVPTARVGPWCWASELRRLRPLHQLPLVYFDRSANIMIPRLLTCWDRTWQPQASEALESKDEMGSTKAKIRGCLPL